MTSNQVSEPPSLEELRVEFTTRGLRGYSALHAAEMKLADLQQGHNVDYDIYIGALQQKESY